MVATRFAVAFIGVMSVGLCAMHSPAVAQDSGQGIDETRVIIPRAKVIRVPASDSEQETESNSASTVPEEDVSETETATVETRPLEPLAGSSSGGGLVPQDELIAATDPAAATGATENPRVRVVRPGADSESETGRGGDGNDTNAATPEDESGPRWLRKRTRRFKLAPKGTEVLDTTRPAYAVPITPTETGLKQGARLRQLDKMTGQTVTFDLSIGEQRRVDRLLVTLDACRSPENNASHGAMAFLKIWDTRNIGGDPNFTGWMFAESPALSALDHPRYDLWVISCTTSAAEVSAVSE